MFKEPPVNVSSSINLLVLFFVCFPFLLVGGFFSIPYRAFFCVGSGRFYLPLFLVVKRVSFCRGLAIFGQCDII